MCAKFQQKQLNCRVVGARQSFQIFRQKAWFLKNNKALPKFLYEILHYLTQPAITCSKLTIETVGQGVKYVQS